MRHEAVNHIDWIESGPFSPQEALNRILERASVELTLIHGFPDFQISDVQISGFRVQASDTGSRPQVQGQGLRYRVQDEPRYRVQDEPRYRDQEPRPRPGHVRHGIARSCPSWHSQVLSVMASPPWVHLQPAHARSRAGHGAHGRRAVVKSVVGLIRVSPSH